MPHFRRSTRTYLVWSFELPDDDPGVATIWIFELFRPADWTLAPAKPPLRLVTGETSRDRQWLMRRWHEGRWEYRAATPEEYADAYEFQFRGW